MTPNQTGALAPPRSLMGGSSRTASLPRWRRSVRSVLASSISLGSTCHWYEPRDWVRRSAVWPVFKRRTRSALNGLANHEGNNL